MAINYDKLLSKLPKDVWVSGPQLDEIWKTAPTTRKYYVGVLHKNGTLQRRGKTTNIQYRLHKKEAVVPLVTPTSTSLNSLIAAASRVGTENEILKKALQEIQLIIDTATKDIL